MIIRRLTLFISSLMAREAERKWELSLLALFALEACSAAGAKRPHRLGFLRTSLRHKALRQSFVQMSAAGSPCRFRHTTMALQQRFLQPIARSHRHTWIFFAGESVWCDLTCRLSLMSQMFIVSWVWAFLFKAHIYIYSRYLLNSLSKQRPTY